MNHERHVLNHSGFNRPMGKQSSAPRKVIFVVDDEAVIADTLAVILRQSGFVAKSFHLPSEVLSAAESLAPDLLISDVTMPVMTGIELAKRIRSRYPQCKCLMFSGQANTAKMLNCAGDDELEVLSKPIHPSELLLRVNELV